MNVRPTSLVGVITITVPDDVDLAHTLYESVVTFVGKVVPDFSGVVALHFEDQEIKDSE